MDDKDLNKDAAQDIREEMPDVTQIETPAPNPAPAANPAPSSNPTPDANPAPEGNPATDSNPAPAEKPVVEAIDGEAMNPEDLDLDEEIPEIYDPHEPRNKIKRGEEINLTQQNPTMRQLNVGVGWDLKKFDTDPVDLDVSVFMLDKDNETTRDEDFVFYNNLDDGEVGAVKHIGDNRTGAGEGDDENIHVDLNKLSYDTIGISFVLSIYDLEARTDGKQNDHDFSLVKNVYFRLVDKETDIEIFRYELDEELTGEKGLIIGVMERIGAEWVFTAKGDLVEGGLAEIAHEYNVIIAERNRG